MTDDHHRKLHDGRDDGLEPLEAIDLGRVENFADMLRAMSKTAFGGRDLGEAYEVLRAMVGDPDCTVVVTVAGAMTVAKQGRILCEMIDRGMADIIVCTGALMAHGLSEAIGCIHYKVDPGVSDEDLFRRGYNRVYDTLEMEANLNRAGEVIGEVLAGMDFSKPISSRELNCAIGQRLIDDGRMPSILGCACRRDVPVYVPALTDSELGLDVAMHVLKDRHVQGDKVDLDRFFDTVPSFNPFLDLRDYTRRVLRAKRLGIFTIGGGVPRNWAQQVGPFVDIINIRLGTRLPVPKFRYGVRICPEPAHWGGLSGCTYSEGVSWGKFVSAEDGGRFAEVRCDATIAWPLLVRAVLEG